jgi:hypothetical protein
MSAEFQLRWKVGPFDAFAFLTTPNQVVPGPPTLPLQFFNPPGPRYTHPVRLVTSRDRSLPLAMRCRSVPGRSRSTTQRRYPPLSRSSPPASARRACSAGEGRKNQQQHSLLDWNTR